MALGLVCVIVAVLTAATGYWFPPVGALRLRKPSTA